MTGRAEATPLFHRSAEHVMGGTKPSILSNELALAVVGQATRRFAVKVRRCSASSVSPHLKTPSASHVFQLTVLFIKSFFFLRAEESLSKTFPAIVVSSDSWTAYTKLLIRRCHSPLASFPQRFLGAAVQWTHTQGGWRRCQTADHRQQHLALNTTGVLFKSMYQKKKIQLIDINLKTIRVLSIILNSFLP